MPIYEYICNQCGNEFEKMVPFSQANTPPSCPKCQAKETQKKLSMFATSAGAASTGSASASSSCSGGGGRFT